MARTLNYTPGGSGSVNLQAILRAAGIKDFSGQISWLHIYNPSAATDVYVHTTNDGANAPGIGTDGYPIGASATAAEKIFKYTKGDQSGRGIDVNTTWLHFPAAVPIKILIDGI